MQSSGVFRQNSLTPITENEEVVNCRQDERIFQICQEPSAVEVNNSSTLPGQTDSQENAVEVGEQFCSLSPRLQPKQTSSGYIEPSSGRRGQNAEVLKQKYLNMEIQDIPRHSPAPFKYGHLYRSRLNVNLGSQDIKQQLNKLRQCHQTWKNDKQQHFRCRKFSQQTLSRRVIEGILNGDLSDDFDQELAALFENYVDECDSISKQNVEEMTSFNRLDPNVVNKKFDDEDDKMSDRSTPEEEILAISEAYMRDFTEGLKRGHAVEDIPNITEEVTRDAEHNTDKGPQPEWTDDHKSASPLGALTDDIKMSGSDILQKVFPGATNESADAEFRSMIRQNQDATTHRFLKHWEQKTRSKCSRNCTLCQHKEPVSREPFASFSKQEEPVSREPFASKSEDKVGPPSETKVEQDDYVNEVQPNMHNASEDVHEEKHSTGSKDENRETMTQQPFGQYSNVPNPQMHSIAALPAKPLTLKRVESNISEQNHKRENDELKLKAIVETNIDATKGPQKQHTKEAECTNMGQDNSKQPNIAQPSTNGKLGTPKRGEATQQRPGNDKDAHGQRVIVHTRSSEEHVFKKRKPMSETRSAKGQYILKQQEVTIANTNHEEEKYAETMQNKIQTKNDGEKPRHTQGSFSKKSLFDRGIPSVLKIEDVGSSSDTVVCNRNRTPKTKGAIRSLLRESNLGDNSPFSVDITDVHKDGNNIVKLAKQKLENKYFSSLILEERYLQKLKAKQIINDSKTAGGQTQQNGRKEKSILSPSGYHLDDLNGWSTEISMFDDTNNIQVSSSDVLHPVDSLDNFTPTVCTPSDSAPSMSPLEQKLFSNPSSSCQPGSIHIHACTSFSACLHGLEIKNNNNIPRETSADLRELRKNTDSIVKLRLTKSNRGMKSGCPSVSGFLDKPFINVPFSHCTNFNIEQDLRHNVTVTTKINLSDKLAQQLKELGQNPAVPKPLQGRKSFSVLAPQEEISSTKSETGTQLTNEEILPAVGGNKLDLAQRDSLQCRSECSLPDNHSQSPCNVTKKTISRQNPGIGPSVRQNPGIGPSVSSFFFPPIKGMSLSTHKENAQSNGQRAMPRHEEHEEGRQCRGIAVRADSCTSPYMFDRGNANKLQVNAKAIPTIHSVCTSCGSINEQQSNTSGHEKKISDRGRNVKNSKQQTDTRCCGSQAAGKLHLQKEHPFNSFATISELGVETLKPHNAKLDDKVHSRKHQSEKKSEVIKESRQLTQCVMSPKSEDKCEELYIRFMNENIKIKFQSGVSAESEARDPKLSEKTWLNKTATPCNRHKMERPVPKETRTYKDNLKCPKVLESLVSLCPSSPRRNDCSSAYLEYCRRKAQMRKSRRHIINDVTAEIKSDTSVTDDFKKASPRQCFPVLPAKKNKDNLNSSGRSSRRILKKDDVEMSVTPARLPVITVNDIRTELTNQQQQVKADRRSNAGRNENKCLRQETPLAPPNSCNDWKAVV